MEDRKPRGYWEGYGGLLRAVREVRRLYEQHLGVIPSKDDVPGIKTAIYKYKRWVGYGVKTWNDLVQLCGLVVKPQGSTIIWKQHLSRVRTLLALTNRHTIPSLIDIGVRPPSDLHTKYRIYAKKDSVSRQFLEIFQGLAEGIYGVRGKMYGPFHIPYRRKTNRRPIYTLHYNRKEDAYFWANLINWWDTPKGKIVNQLNLEHDAMWGENWNEARKQLEELMEERKVWD